MVSRVQMYEACTEACTLDLRVTVSTDFFRYYISSVTSQ